MKTLARADGFKWRKYGKKEIAGQVRHYYRCTHARCLAKKQTRFVRDAQGAPTALNVVSGSHSHSGLRLDSCGDQEAFLRVVEEHFEDRAQDSPGVQLVLAPQIDPVEDGGMWFHYGTKKLRGGAARDAYFQCSGRDCPVKKIIQYAEVTRVCYSGSHHPRCEFGGKRKERRHKKRSKQ